jgi:hypothetical protein
LWWPPSALSSTTPTAALNFPGADGSSGAQGLPGLAFDPNFVSAARYTARLVFLGRKTA